MRRKRRIFQDSDTLDYPAWEHTALPHLLVELTDTIDLATTDRVDPESFQPGRSRTGLVAGLLYLQHAFNAPDEQDAADWPKNPYWQGFGSKSHLQATPPIGRSSLSRRCKGLGKAAQHCNLHLRKNYNRTAPCAYLRSGRPAVMHKPRSNFLIDWRFDWLN